MPGRLLFSRVDERLVAATLLVLLVLGTRIPLRTRYLMNWDAVQFALGMRAFDVVHHQPHPPGYPGYIALGRILEGLAGDANSALVALSIAGEAGAVCLAFLFARRLYGSFAGWASALALAASPLFWYYGEVANTYALEPALALAIAWLCRRLWEGERSAVLPAALALGLAGSLRPSTMVLLLPLFAVSLWRAGSAAVAARGGALLAAVVGAWLAPLVIASGGLGRYLAATLELGDSVTSGTAIWRDPGALRVALGAVAAGLSWELGALVVVLVFGLGVAPLLLRKTVLPRSDAAFFAIWAAPALATFILVHIGQLVYVQLFTPALFLLLGPALVATSQALGRPRLAPVLLAAGAVANVAMFFLPTDAALATQLRSHDDRTERLLALSGRLDSESVLLVTDAYGAGSYRSGQYYLPRAHRAAIQRDRQGRLGEIYGDVYDPVWSRRASPLAAPPGVVTYVFMDSTLLYFIADGARLERVPLGDGSSVYVWEGPLPVVSGNQLWLLPPPPDRHRARPA